MVEAVGYRLGCVVEAEVYRLGSTCGHIPASPSRPAARGAAGRRRITWTGAGGAPGGGVWGVCGKFSEEGLTTLIGTHAAEQEQVPPAGTLQSDVRAG